MARSRSSSSSSASSWWRYCNPSYYLKRPKRLALLLIVFVSITLVVWDRQTLVREHEVCFLGLIFDWLVIYFVFLGSCWMFWLVELLCYDGMLGLFGLDLLLLDCIDMLLRIGGSGIKTVVGCFVILDHIERWIWMIWISCGLIDLVRGWIFFWWLHRMLVKLTSRRNPQDLKIECHSYD